MITRQTGLEYSYTTTTMAMAITIAIFLFAISRVSANGHQPAKSERMKAGAAVESRPLDLYTAIVSVLHVHCIIRLLIHCQNS